MVLISEADDISGGYCAFILDEENNKRSTADCKVSGKECGNLFDGQHRQDMYFVLLTITAYTSILRNTQIKAYDCH